MNKKTKEYIIMTLGILLVALSAEYFIIPNDMASGGITGFSMVVNDYFPAFSVEAYNFVFNVILFIAGFIVIGGEFGGKTLYSAMGLSGLMWLIKTFLNPHAITSDLMLNVIFASGLTGTGLALVFMQDASTGGTDIIAKILNKYFKINMGRSMQVVDAVVVVLGGITFGWEKGMYALVIVLLNGLIIDKVIAGNNSCKEILIMSKKHEIIKNFIIKDVNRGCTIIPARGAYSNAPTDMLYCVANRKQFLMIKAFLKENDPDAFIIVSDAHEVLGQGFSEI